MMTFLVVITISASVLVLPHVVLLIAKQFWRETTGKIRAVRFGVKRGMERKCIRTFDIHYVFEAFGRLHDGQDSVTIDVPYYEEKDAKEALVSEYKAGDEIVVYFSAKNPASNSLTRSVGIWKILYNVGFLLILVIGYNLYISYAYELEERMENQGPRPSPVIVTPPSGQE